MPLSWKPHLVIADGNLRTRGTRWLDWLLAFAAVGSLAATVAANIPPIRTSEFTASDLKTLFASTWCFLHGQNAYDLANIAAVFRHNDIVSPGTWFGHAPVYPPFTLALLSPMVLFGPVITIRVVFVLSTMLFALATAALLRYSASTLGLPLPGRLVIASFCAAVPALAFALSLGNVSVAACALLVPSFLWRRSLPRWLVAAFLACSLLLKPHIGFWTIACMVLLPEPRTRGTALRGCALMVAFAAFTALILAGRGELGLQMHGWLAMLHSERGGAASMSPGTREVLPLVSQICSLESVLGFWWAKSLPISIVTGILLLLSAAVLIARTWRASSEREALLCGGAWSAFGLLATYHREHDALVLILLLPFLLDLWRRGQRVWPLTALVCLASIFLGPSLETAQAVVRRYGDHSWIDFLVLRQAALGDCLLLIALLFVPTQLATRPLEKRGTEVDGTETPRLHSATL